MKRDDAIRAGQIAAQITVAERRVSDIDKALAEQWPVSALRVRAPEQGASDPAGTEIDLLAGTSLPIADLWKIALTTARDLHQTTLSGLSAELDAL